MRVFPGTWQEWILSPHLAGAEEFIPPPQPAHIRERRAMEKRREEGQIADIRAEGTARAARKKVGKHEKREKC